MEASIAPDTGTLSEISFHFVAIRFFAPMAAYLLRWKLPSHQIPGHCPR